MSVAAVAFVPDLMDRSRFAGHPVRFVATLDELRAVAPGVQLVLVDLARPGAAEAAAELVGQGLRVVGFAPHVDDELRALAGAGGVEVLARSRFFGRLDEVMADR